MGSSSSKSQNMESHTKDETAICSNKNENTRHHPKHRQEKREVLQHSNQRLASKVVRASDHGNTGGPLIAVQNDAKEQFKVDDKSVSESIRESARKWKLEEDDRLEAEKKEREETSIHRARVDSLREQLQKGVVKLGEKHRNDLKASEDLDIIVNTIGDLEITLRRFQEKNDYKIFKDRRKNRDELCRQFDENVTQKTKLVLRISELAGVQLKHNNPNIADLSDENRASRLFAKFSELYDNECTDLMEAYSDALPKGYEEKVVVSHIRDCLQLCYQKCQWVAEEQRKQFVRLLYKSENMEYPKTTVGLQLRVKEFQKNATKMAIPSIRSNVHSEILKAKRLQNLNDRIKPRNSPMHPKLKAFLDRATELCWITQIQDPPVVLVFKTRTTGDYRSYTKSGPRIDYIVWPVLLLHENGPVLYRGIAQFRADDEAKQPNHGNSLSLQNKDSNKNKQVTLNKTVTKVEKSDSKSPRVDKTGSGLPSVW